MKKILLCVVLLALIQNWDRLNSLFVPAPSVPNTGEVQVILYSTAWCRYCTQARSLLKSSGIPYREYDIEKSAEGLQQFKALGGRGVPLLIINGKVLSGFDKSQILQELRWAASAGAKPEPR